MKPITLARSHRAIAMCHRFKAFVRRFVIYVDCVKNEQQKNHLSSQTGGKLKQYASYGNSFPYIKTSPHGLTLINTQISEQNNMKKIYLCLFY